MSNNTAEAIRIMEELPESGQVLALNLLHQVLKAWRIQNEIPNDETMEALKEGEEMILHPENYKRYSTFRDFMEEMEQDA
ncbi:MAG: hypothetical protein IJ617_07085 [Oscillospiraceae bacterium]|nr:hypothetical protein [Oscillospiraceae bacterium]